MSSSLIITAPHSFCYRDVPYRHCDTASYMVSSRLMHANMNGVPVKYFPAPYPRAQIDLNRPVSDNTDYRQKIRAELPQAKLLVDIHSFPRKGFGPDVDLVVLDNVPGTWYGKLLYDLLRHQGISVAYIPGFKYNAITEEARHARVPAILLEYGEFLDLDQIDRINRVVEKWIQYMLSL